MEPKASLLWKTALRRPIRLKVSYASFLCLDIFIKWLVHAWTKFNPGKKESIFWFCLVIFHYLNGITNFSILNKTLDVIILPEKPSFLRTSGKVSYSESLSLLFRGKSIMPFKISLETSRIVKNMEILSDSLLKWWHAWHHKNFLHLHFIVFLMLQNFWELQLHLFQVATWCKFELHFYYTSLLFLQSLAPLVKLDRLVLPKLFLGNPVDCMLWLKTQKHGFEKHSMR